jgi:hypothetical protein
VVFRLSESAIDQSIANARHYLLLGLLLTVVPLTLPGGLAFGLFSGFMLFSLGIYSRAFRRWRTEPGLWMLAVFLTVMLGPCWLYFEFLHVRGLVFPPGPRRFNWNQLRLFVDSIVALLLFSHIVKLSIGVSIENWKRTRNP